MLIRNQDKTSIVNFDKIESLDIHTLEGTAFMVQADAKINLGIYNSLENAKQAIDAVVNEYKNSILEKECFEMPPSNEFENNN